MRHLATVLLAVCCLAVGGCGKDEPPITIGSEQVLAGNVESAPDGYELKLKVPKRFSGDDICDGGTRHAIWLSADPKHLQRFVGQAVEVSGTIACPRGGWIISVVKVVIVSAEIPGQQIIEAKSKKPLEQDTSVVEFRFVGDDGSRHFYLAPRTVEKHDSNSVAWVLTNAIAPKTVEGKSFNSYLMKVLVDCEGQEASTGPSTFWSEKNASGVLVKRVEETSSRVPVVRGTILSGIRHVICPPWSEGQEILDKIEKETASRDWPMRVKIPGDLFVDPARAASDKGGAGTKPAFPPVSGTSQMTASRTKAAGAMSAWLDLISRFESRSSPCQGLARSHAKPFTDAHNRFQRAIELEDKMPPTQVASIYDSIELTARTFLQQAKSLSATCGQ